MHTHQICRRLLGGGGWAWVSGLAQHVVVLASLYMYLASPHFLLPLPAHNFVGFLINPYMTVLAFLLSSTRLCWLLCHLLHDFVGFLGSLHTPTRFCWFFGIIPPRLCWLPWHFHNTRLAWLLWHLRTTLLASLAGIARLRTISLAVGEGCVFQFHIEWRGFVNVHEIGRSNWMFG